MTRKVPLIGFDRYVDIDWCRSALDAAATESPIEVVRDHVATMLPGVESQRKTLDILKRLSTKPFDHLVDFISRGIDIYMQLGKEVLLPLVWGASIASYPFFGKTSETSGRLLALQGDCSIKELHRRMAEQYGDRSGIERAVTRVLQTQVSWQAIERDESAKRITKRPTILINDPELIAWLIESVGHYTGKPIPMASIQSLPVLYPFDLMQSIPYVVSISENLLLRSEGPSTQYVALRSTM